MKAKTKIKQQSQINNLKLEDISVLTDAGVDPKDFEFVGRYAEHYKFRHIKKNKMLFIRR